MRGRDGTYLDLPNKPELDRESRRQRGVDGKPIQIGDLWSLTPGNAGSAGSKGEIYFTSGVQGESQGLFGSISRVAGTNDFMVSGSSSHGMTS